MVGLLTATYIFFKITGEQASPCFEQAELRILISIEQYYKLGHLRSIAFSYSPVLNVDHLSRIVLFLQFSNEKLRLQTIGPLHIFTKQNTTFFLFGSNSRRLSHNSSNALRKLMHLARVHIVGNPSSCIINIGR